MTLEIACPLCDAKPGEPCYGDDLPFKGQHAERVEAGRARTFADTVRDADDIRAAAFAGMMRDAGPPEAIPVDLALPIPRRKAKAEVAIGDAVEVFVIERSPFTRGTSEKWLPATVSFVGRDSISVTFGDHQRLSLPINDSGRNWRYAQ